MTKLRGFPFQRAKYGNKKAVYKDRTYASKKEMAYAVSLDARLKAGDVLMWLGQCPMYLPGGVKYIVDFIVWRSDGMCEFVDCKGFKTETYKVKKRLVESLYPVTIVEV